MLFLWEFSHASCQEKEHEKSHGTCSGLEKTDWREVHSGQHDLDRKTIVNVSSLSNTKQLIYLCKSS